MTTDTQPAQDGCPCEAPRHRRANFCTACGAALEPAAPWTRPSEPHPDEARLTPDREHELVRALRDVEDGHLGLWGTPGDVIPDRVVSGRLHSVDWVGIMLHRGWVAPNAQSAREVLVITEAGRLVLKEQWKGWRNTSAGA